MSEFTTQLKIKPLLKPIQIHFSLNWFSLHASASFNQSCAHPAGHSAEGFNGLCPHHWLFPYTLWD